jgi:hypothetical protein
VKKIISLHENKLVKQLNMLKEYRFF